MKRTLLLLGLVMITSVMYSQTVLNFTIQQPAPPVASFTSTPTGTSVMFAGNNPGNIVAWAWDFGDGSSDTTQNPSHNYASSGGLFITCLTVTDQYGCTATACDSLVLVSISQGLPVVDLNVFPNPVTQQTKVSYGLLNAGHVKMSITNLLGQQLIEVLDEPQTAGLHVMELNTKLASGIYLLQLDVDGIRQTLRISFTN